ncbi:helix-turn-helix transcriptional regulator [Bacillus cereus group sp. N6]|uniref:ArsR/SmtB family transcription factor n=1 Tax=Bacillus cereus group sp. N6 TaxID=2794583 RepID=UPI0018F3E716|nr:metalloregulator ArsR/SmtB family transcription factor [Bacillus cereus group sp. N6]MBJ8113842.1 helix-turn-helix transcriptional regulator [Bacillus cereus group sp. N6]
MNDFHIYEEQADVLRHIAHPVRLQLLQELIRRGGCNVTELCHILKIPQSTTSQHLAKLKRARIVRSINQGTLKTYQVCHEQIHPIINILMKVK